MDRNTGNQQDLVKSEFFCGSEKRDILDADFLFEPFTQKNFKFQVENCFGNLFWTINGMSLEIQLPDIRDSTCTGTFQRMVWSIRTSESIDTSKIEEIRFNS